MISKPLRQLFILMRGNSIAQIIPILITPIITRLYSIEELGALAVFVALSSILAALSPAGLEQAILLPKSNRRAYRVMTVSLFSVMLVTTIVLFVFGLIYLINPSIRIVQQLGFLFWLIPISSTLLALINIVNQMQLRLSRISIISNGVILKFVSLGLIQVLWGWIVKYGAGLIYGRIISNIRFDSPCIYL